MLLLDVIAYIKVQTTKDKVQLLILINGWGGAGRGGGVIGGFWVRLGVLCVVVQSRK